MPKKEETADELIKSSVHWKHLERQLTHAEQTVFLEHWREILKQFKNDVFYTEYMTIVDLVNLEIRINRLLEDQQGARASIRRGEDIIANEMSKPEQQRNSNTINAADTNMASSRGACIQLDKQYLEMLRKKEEIMKSLKSTRDQRVKMVENSKTNFQDWIKAMMNSPEKRSLVGIEMEKMRLAMDKERERLDKPHQYLDKEVDVPILNSDSVVNLE